MYRTRRSLWIGAWALAALGLGSVEAAAAEASGSFDRTLKVETPLELDVGAGAGSITVRGSATDRATIHGDVRVSTYWGRSLQDAQALVSRLEMDPPIELDGTRLRVGHLDAHEFSHNVVINYVLEVPVGSAVKAASGSGDQSITGVAGPLDVATGSGNIELTKIGSESKARAGSGDIRAERIAGAFTAKTGSGDIDFSAAGPGDIDVSTGSGRGNLRDIDGAAHVRTGSGDIRIAGAVRDRWDLEAGSGGIRVGLAPDAAFDLDAHSGSGNLRSSHPVTVEGLNERNTLRGSVRGGGPLVRVRTGSGDIVID